MELEVNYGLITLLPPIIIIGFALITRKTFEALILGAAVAFLIADKGKFVTSTLDAMTTVVTENAWMWLTLGLFGSFVALLTASRGTYGFAKLIIRFADGPKKSLIMSWVLGVVVFMDDYLNILTVSAAMRDVSDRNKNPREMLAYIIDSTGAPVCVLVPLSTWAVFFGSVFQEQKELTDIASGISLYWQGIPFIFYAWAAVIIVPLAILKIIPPLFAMKKAFIRANERGMVFSEKSAKYNTEMREDLLSGDLKSAIWPIINFLAPIGLLIVITIKTEDLLVGLVYSLILQLVLYVATRAVKFGDFTERFARGFADMIPMLFICAGALTVKMAMDQIGLPKYVINAVLPYMTPALFPAITFIVVAGLSFITGSNWGIPAVTVPIIAPLAVLSGAHVPMTLAAIVSGGTFGSHACFYSDATVLTSQASGIDNMEHAITQLPYAVIGAILAIGAYIGFGLALT